MSTLLKNATIVDQTSPHHLQKKDILIANGKIKEIAKSIKTTDKVKVIELKNLHVSCGWFDTSVSFGEPGFEE
ncbi:MAG: dihydroorotase, partial [Flavobacteriaceae bacterium]|nr:dihydroorotase [Flavobacteriaceae bacterium]